MKPLYLNSLISATDYIFQSSASPLRIATPLGLGKPNPLINAIYNRALLEKRPLSLYTALSLTLPQPQRKMEKVFLEPFLERHYGPSYPHLKYVQDRKKKLPSSIQVHEFYMQAAQNLHVESAQREYTSLNYTHVAQSLFTDGVQFLVQMISQKASPSGSRYSLSCNPDLSLDLIELYKKNQKNLFLVGVVHPDLPFMEGDAEIPADFFDVILQCPEMNHSLFSLPHTPLKTTDYMIGLYASQLIADGGTLQIGIGSLSDGLVAATLLRHQQNELYQKIIKDLPVTGPVDLHHHVFHEGLYGTSEMVMDAFMHLREAGVLKREIFDLDENKKRYLHGAFFLGSKKFYQWLRELSPEDRAGFGMTRVSKVNDLYDSHELALRRQRQKARFFNTCMSVTLLGGAASETLENGQVISGVGGQYNFVAMAHELADAHSILLLKSTHGEGRHRKSNIVWSQGHLTIPRHLRDVVVTEYGIAFLKGRSDEDVIQALLRITDSAFQKDLIRTAKKYGKLGPDYVLPQEARENTPEKLARLQSAFSKQWFKPYPFGSDFTPTEERISLALSHLQKSQASPLAIATLFLKGLQIKNAAFADELRRMPLGFFESTLLKGALQALYS